MCACAGVPEHLQAELVLMSPSMVHGSQHDELASMLLEGFAGSVASDSKSSFKLSQAARIPALAALSQMQTPDIKAWNEFLDHLSLVCISAPRRTAEMCSHDPRYYPGAVDLLLCCDIDCSSCRKKTCRAILFCVRQCVPHL